MVLDINNINYCNRWDNKLLIITIIIYNNKILINKITIIIKIDKIICLNNNKWISKIKINNHNNKNFKIIKILIIIINNINNIILHIQIELRIN